MNLKLNKGLSGCKLEFISDKYIRKYSSDINYNNRLKLQINKQKKFSKLNILNIKTPYILCKGFNNSLSYFDMEYISGNVPFDIFIYEPKSKIDNFIIILINYFDFILENSKKIPILNFKQKSIEKLNNLYFKSNNKDLINFIIKKIKDLQNDSFLESFCHGDFTIVNMIYSNDNIYLIDFLDSFIDSPLIDLVKLKQDLYYNWALNNLENYSKHDYYRAIQVSKFIWNKIYERYKSIIDTKEFEILEIINFLRIEPYIKNNQMIISLNKIIKSLKIYEEFNHTNGREII